MRVSGGSDRRPPPRRGYGLLEVAMAAFVLMVAMGVVLRVVGWVVGERRASERRLFALEESTNLLERLTAEPFDRLDADRARELAARSAAAARLPGAEWEIGVEASERPHPRGKRVRVGLRWRDAAGGDAAPVCLSAWVFDAERPS